MAVRPFRDHADNLGACTFAEPREGPDPPPPPVELLTHTRVSAQFDAQHGGVCLTWGYPDSPGKRAPLRTLIQRYATARQWELGAQYPVDTDTTHEANRYHGNEATCVDTDGLEPGKWYLYYVFLEQTDAAGKPAFVLSQRCDVAVPVSDDTPREGVLEVGSQASHGALLIELEKRLMSGKFMAGDTRARKVRFQLFAVDHPALCEHVAPVLHAEAGGELTAAGDLTYVLRGSYSRQQVLKLAQQLPRIDDARYAARVELSSGATDPGP